ncbi:MAG: OmpH family outer membrane protein [Muribaculaceae bacterium]|nr:OmpH family outer membrane protein [Muribaculaceae bacterium]
MKKTAIAAFTIALLTATACSNKQAEQTESVSETQVSAVDPGEGFQATTNIRYVDLDSIGEHYYLAKDVQEFTLKTYAELDQAQRTRAAEIQRFAVQVDDKVKSNGYLSEASYNADMQKLQKMQTDAQNALQALQNKAERELAMQNQQLNDSIQSYLVEFNKTRHYDAILIKATGLYFNPALDITKEVIEGLNARYNKVK